MANAYINRIATALPPCDVHQAFLAFGHSLLEQDRRKSILFRRMADRSGVEHRYSFLDPIPNVGGFLAAHTFYRRGQFPDTAVRMKLFAELAPILAAAAVDKLQLGEDRARVTHLLVTCCTGFSAPGVDLNLIERCGLPTTVERTMIGFMGCYAAINALKLARHIVRSEPDARVIVLNLELCTLHLQETTDVDKILSFLIFGDGCAASLITAERSGIALDDFHAVLVPNTGDLITWNIGEQGFDMVLSGQVPGAINDGLRASIAEILHGSRVESIDLWAIHPGGRTILEAVSRALELGQGALSASWEILRRYGNMSSATVMFVLESMLETATNESRGCAMSFGPGLTAETMRFHMVR